MAGQSRVESLDLFRGLAVGGMILVNSPGSWDHVYPPLLHADWHGWTAADLVFPAFLFAVGVALALAFPRRIDWPRVLRRAATLFLLGLALNLLGGVVRMIWLGGADSIANLRIPGILQRIALCYLLAVALIALTGRRDGEGRTALRLPLIAAAIVAILLVYWVMLAGALDKAGNLAGQIDRALLSPRHIWRLGSAVPGGPPVYDPEGLLATLPATSTVLLGVLAASALRAGRTAWIAAAGVALILAGLALDPFFPINKSLWTSSYVLLSGGFSALALSGLALAAPHAGRLFAPLRVLGGNAILAFVASVLLGLFGAIPFGGTSLQQSGQAAALAILGDPRAASLACAFGILALITLAVWPLHRRGVHLRL